MIQSWEKLDYPKGNAIEAGDYVTLINSKGYSHVKLCINEGLLKIGNVYEVYSVRRGYRCKNYYYLKTERSTIHCAYRENIRRWNG